jgi:hypothetical protein
VASFSVGAIGPIFGWRQHQASVTAARTIHQDTAKPAAVSDTALPERMTASTSWSRSPGRGAGTARHLWRAFEERKPVARRLFAVPAVLGPGHVHQTGNANITESLNAAFLPAGRDDPAARAARKLVAFDDHLPLAGNSSGENDSVVGQDKENGGSVSCDPGRLDRGSWSCSRLNA